MSNSLMKPMKKQGADSGVVFGSLLAVLALLALMASVASYAGLHSGYVFTRGMVLSDAGNPIWVEYDETGQVAAEIGEATGNLDPAKWWVMSGERYRGFVKTYENLQAQYPDLEPPLSREAYLGGSFQTVDGQTITKPGLANSTAYVSILPQSRRLIDVPAQFILAEYPINPAQNIGENIQSMLVNRMGETQAQTTRRIGFKSNFLGDKPSNHIYRDYEDVIHGPVPDVVIEGHMFNKGVTDETGHYMIRWYSIPCPMHYYSMDGYATATLYSRRFHPRAKGPYPYFLMKPYSETCFPDPPFFVPFFGPMPITMGNPRTYPFKLDFPLDVTVLSGVAYLSSGQGIVPVSEQTEYDAGLHPLPWFPSDEQRDLDGDGIIDPILLGTLEYDETTDTQTFVEQTPTGGNYAGLLHGVFYSSRGTTPGEDTPDFTYAVPQASNFSHEGLLTGLAKEDLRNTDIYVFREADNKLITERIGLSESEVGISDFGADDENSRFFYRMEMRGALGDLYRFTRGRFRFHSEFPDFQAESGMNPELHQVESDHLKPGDLIRIVAVNRATGYMGSTRTVMQAAGSGAGSMGSDLSWDIDRIVMFPPNLKIWVERDYDVKAGLTQGEIRKEQIIGYEGAGLTSDHFIAIYTEWLDQDGSPLPAEMDHAGYTGRLAHLVADRQLPDSGGGIYQFDIKPGKHLQVLQLPQGILDAQHFYIQVSGEPGHGNPIFSNNNRVSGPDFSSGEHSGPLEGRPNRYTPFKTPVLNELASREQLAAYYRYLAEHPGSSLPKPDPIYQWVYRPEMQFTLYDLEVDHLKLETTPEAGTQLDIGYSLSTSPYDLLETFQGEKALLFDLMNGTGGEQFAQINHYGETTARFENLEILQSLEDRAILSLQLTTRHDSFNPIYEYVGIPLVLSSTSQVQLKRNTALGAFNADANNAGASDITDNFTVRSFYLSQEANVKVELLNHNKTVVKALVQEQILPINNYSFILTYSDVAAALPSRPGVDFYVRISADAANDLIEHTVLIPGDIGTDVSSEMLGQVLQHDVLIQRGSLNLRREDLSLQGRGPALTFIRSYSNEARRENADGPLGPGWSHNHNLFVQVLAVGDGAQLGQYNLPNWIFDYRGGVFDTKIVPSDSLPRNVNDDPSLVLVSNGGLFKKVDGVWHAQRGRHGSISFNGSAFEYRSKDGTLYSFDGVSKPGEKGYLNYVADRNGNRLTYAYEDEADTSKRLSTVTDAIGRSLTFHYSDDQGGQYRLNNVECSCGITLAFGYSNAWGESPFNENFGMLQSFTRGDFVETYEYDFNTEADDLVNLVASTDPIGQTTQYRYVDPASVPEQLSFYVKGLNKHDVAQQVIYPDDHHAEFAYAVAEANNRVVTGLRGNNTTYFLNTYGNPNRILSPLGHAVEMVWTIDQGLDDNLIISRTDEFNNTTTYEYDNFGNLILETDSYGNTLVQTWYTDFTVLKRREDKNGKVFRQEIDDKGNVTDEYQDAVVAGLAATVHRSHSYNGFGERTATTDGRGNTTTYGYDDWGLLALVDEPLAGQVTYVNDARGRRLQKTDARGHTWTYDYDALDRVTLVTDPEGNTVAYDYDAKGNKTQEVHTDAYLAGGSEYTRTLTLDYTYGDDRDRVTSVTRSGSVAGLANSALGGSKTFSYDANSNLLSESDWKGVATTHSYDALNRRTSTTNRDGKTMTIDYAFVNHAGLRKTTTDYEGRVTVEHYDRLHRLARIQLPTVQHYDGSSDSYERTYGYDHLDHVTRVTDENGHVTHFEYDGRYLKIKQTNALNDDFIWEYDANGNLAATVDEAERRTTFEYDAQNRMTHKHQPEGLSWQYSHDANGNVTSETDPWGFTLTTAYDKVNQPTSRTHPEGTVTLAYTHDGLQTYERDAEGRESVSLYAPDSRLVRAIDPVGRTTDYTYDANGNPTDLLVSWNNAATGPSSVATHLEYDPLDRVVQRYEGYGSSAQRLISYSYDRLGNRLSETYPDGRVTQFQYDALNRQIQSTDADGKNAYQKFDGVGNLVKVVDRRGHSTTTTYDALNRVDVITDALGQTLDRDYDKVGNLRFETDKRGTTTEHRYDGVNRLVATYKPKTQGATPIRLIYHEYDFQGLNGHKDRIVDANGNAIEHTYNWRAQILRTDYPAGQGYEASFTQATYDRSGFKTAETDELSNTTQFTYHDDGQLKTATNAENETRHYQYDLFGNQAIVTPPKGESYRTTYTYDARNRLVGVEDAAGNRTTYEYDANDNLRHQYLPAAGAGQVHVEYTYDVLNRKRSHLQHKAGGNLVVSYEYDAAGNLVKTTDAKGQVFTYDYDALNRLRVQHFPAGSDVQQIVTTYDPNNNTDTVTETKTSGTEVTDMDYDRLDRMTRIVQRGHEITYAYDDNGNRTQVTASGGATAYTFDARNRLATAVGAGGTTTYDYFANGWKNTCAYPNGTLTTYAYDQVGRLDTLTHTAADASVISSFDYAYDDHGNRIEQIERQNGFADQQQQTTVYTYDLLDRMESYTLTDQASGDTSHTQYTFYPSYDRATEVVTATVSGTATVIKNRSYAYDETFWLTQITDEDSGDQIVYTYDPNGNTLTKADHTQPTPAYQRFIYNSRDQLVEAIRGPPGSEVSAGRYDYDYRGLRIRHLGSERGDIEYLYDGQAVLEEVVNHTQSLVAHYRYADRLLSLTTPSDTQYYHFAALGTTANLTDETGAVEKSYRVDPYGEITREAGASVNRQVFTGQEHDEQTGLIYFGARYYDPDTARFMTQDSYLGQLGTPPSLNRYLYAYGNPTVYVDLTGYAALLASGQEFDDFGYELYEQGKPVQAGLVAIGSAFYKVGTGFFTLGLFDEANDAITTTDTYYDAANQFGASVANTVEEVAQEYVEEGVVAGTATVAGKLACGRWRQVCDKAIETGKNVYDKLNTDVTEVVKKKENPEITVEDLSGLSTEKVSFFTVPNNNSIRVSREQALINVRKEAEDLGVEIRVGQEADDYLDMSARMAGIPPEKMHAVTLGDDLIMVRQAHANDPRVLREELLHTQQQKPGFEVSTQSTTNAEIQVREMMIQNRHQWGLTNDEVREMIQDIRIIRERGGY